MCCARLRWVFFSTENTLLRTKYVHFLRSYGQWSLYKTRNIFLPLIFERIIFKTNSSPLVCFSLHISVVTMIRAGFKNNRYWTWCQILPAAAFHTSVLLDVSMSFCSARVEAFGSSAPSGSRLSGGFRQCKIAPSMCTEKPLRSRQCLQPRQGQRSRAAMGNYGKLPALAGVLTALAGELSLSHRGGCQQTMAPRVLFTRAGTVDCGLRSVSSGRGVAAFCVTVILPLSNNFIIRFPAFSLLCL